MSNQAQRISPVNEALASLRPRLGTLHGMPVALDYGAAVEDADRLSRLALCDASVFPRFGVVGKGAPVWLEHMGIPVPGDIYGSAPLPSDGLCLRLGRHEFVLEDGCEGEITSVLASALGTGQDRVYPIERQDAQFLLSGSRAWEVLAQTCGYNFRTPGDRLVFTRIAGVSCGVLHQAPHGFPIFRLWLDSTYAAYLWETLLEIGHEMDGGVVGLASFYPRINSLAL